MVRRNKVRDILSGFGFSETINYSFISAESCDRMGMAENDPRRRHVALINPISEEQAVMRTTLVPGMLETAQRNISRQQNGLRLFEVGKVFLPQPDALLPIEKEMLAGLWTGPRVKSAWYTQESACDFFDIKGAVEGLALALGISELSFTALPDDQCCYTRAGHSAQILCPERMLGIVGEVDTQVVNAYSLKQPTFIFELDLEMLGQVWPGDTQMTPIPPFPLDDPGYYGHRRPGYRIRRMLDAVMIHFGEKLVEDLYLFDVFSGDPIPAGKKSVSFRVVYRSDQRTLEDDTVNGIHHHLTHRLITEFGAALPT